MSGKRILSISWNRHYFLLAPSKKARPTHRAVLLWTASTARSRTTPKPQCVPTSGRSVHRDKMPPVLSGVLKPAIFSLSHNSGSQSVFSSRLPAWPSFPFSHVNSFLKQQFQNRICWGRKHQPHVSVLRHPHLVTASSSLLQTSPKEKAMTCSIPWEFTSEGMDALCLPAHIPSKMIWHAQKDGRWWLMALFTLFQYAITGKEITFVEKQICRKNKQPKVQVKQNSLYILTFQM